MKEIKTLFLLNKKIIIFWSYFIFQGRRGELWKCFFHPYLGFKNASRRGTVF